MCISRSFFLGGINEIYDFFISLCWYGQLFFQFSKTFFQFFHFNFSWRYKRNISNFSILIWWYGQFFSNFKNKIFLFKFRKQKFSFQISKTKKII
jgi:hypothetical protein